MTRTGDVSDVTARPGTPGGWVAALATVAGLVVTGLILLTPYLAFGVESPDGHLVLDTVDACIGALVVFLLYGRVRRLRRLQDLLLAYGLALLVFAGAALTAVTAVTGESDPERFDIWLPVLVRSLGAALIAAAAVTSPDRRVDLRTVRRSAAAWVATLGLSWLALWAMQDALPVALDLAELPDTAQHPLFTGHPALLVAQGLSAALFVVAALGFTRQAVRSGDELFRWAGPAFVLAAFARLNYLMFPSLYTDWLYTGDLLRTASYVLLLLGAVREIQHYWQAQSDLALLEDRRRLARELHDGVVQELNLIRAGARRLPAEDGAPILAAVDRGLDEARAAVAAMQAGGDAPLAAMLETATGQLAQRYAVDVELDLDPAIDVEPVRRHALTRIAREAIVNASRHGSARRVRVRLAAEDGPVLSVQDDGCGFDVAAARARRTAGGSGFGLRSMEERAGGLPGSLSIVSSPGEGCVVTVRWDR